jgi:hypothetical protein
MYRKALRAGLFTLLAGATLAMGWTGHGVSAAFHGHSGQQAHVFAGGGPPIWPPPVS